MKKIFVLGALSLGSILLVSSCSKDHLPQKDKINQIVLPEKGAEVIQANNQFAFDFFKAALASDPERNNKLISPLSIYLALAMVYNGADHATKDSIAKAMRISGLDIDALNKVCQSLLSQLPAEDSRVQLDVANSIWYRKGRFKPSFLHVMQHDFYASVKGLNFDDPASVSAINKWVSDQTRKKIEKIIDDISPDELMFIINAVYFNGKWKMQFDKSLTKDDNFHLYDGSISSVPFMNQKLKLMIAKTPKFTIAELPYGAGDGFSMYVLQPSGEQSVSALASSLNKDILNNAIRSMDSSLTMLSIPKWEYAYEISDMRPELSAMGMGIAFNPQRADFSKMYDAVDVGISRAIHKTYIKVDEQGTEAAAVTGFGFETTSMPMIETLKLDHPFLYMIIEKQTGAILFMGVVNDPHAKGKS